MRKPLLSLVAILLLSVTVGACGGGEKGTPTAETPGASPAAGPVTIDLWHSEVAANQETLSRLADQFNASQNEVKVRVSFQGGYDDAMAKLIASLPTGNVPAIMFPGDTYMQTMIDSGAVAPIQDFVDRDGYDLSDLDQKGVQYYTSQGKLWAMPFTMEIPLLYYNKVPFREVGLDPEKPPQDLEELRQYSEKLLKHDAAGNVVRSGIALEIGPRWSVSWPSMATSLWTTRTGAMAARPRSSSTTTPVAGSSSGGTTWWIGAGVQCGPQPQRDGGARLAGRRLRSCRDDLRQRRCVALRD